MDSQIISLIISWTVSLIAGGAGGTSVSVGCSIQFNSIQKKLYL